ncbi:MAG: glycosyltransferase family 87 protein [Pseudomonadota bacterium]
MPPIRGANAWLSSPDRQGLLTRLAVLYGLLFLLTTVLVSVLTPGLLNGERGIIGADFLAFYTASDMTLQGRALEAYDFAAFDAALQTRAPSDELGLMWQYPPLMYLIIAPLALLPYKLSFWVWMALTAIVFAWANVRLIREAHSDEAVCGRAFLLILAAPMSVGVLINGQISLLTAALLMLAAYRPRRYWLVAGLAAGLLTVKPQLGLLLPLAFLVVGAWRAFGIAAITTVFLHGVSLAVFGPESFELFLSAVSRLQADVAGSGLLTPPVNMTTVFGQLRHWGLPSELAMLAQYLTAISILMFVTWVWFHLRDDRDQRLYLAALLSAGAILVTPYAYAYEMAALAPAAIWIALRPNRFQHFAPLILVGFWSLLALRRFLPMDFVLQVPFLVASGAFLLLVLARPERADRS